MAAKNSILVAVLNWGLGHASRSIPVIQSLLSKNKDVILAGEGRSLDLLKVEFPELQRIQLPAYDISYFSENMFLNIGWQFPRIVKAIWKEHKQLKEIVRDYQIDGIISDNRFGCYHSKIPSVFISHQLNIQIPQNKWIQNWVNFCNKWVIQKFESCWIPDEPGKYSIAGKLSENTNIPNSFYIGLLSRMQALESPKKYDVIAVLSGPEPQRSYLEKAIVQQLKKLSLRSLIVAGKTEVTEQMNTGDITLKSYMATKELNEAIASSTLVISRSGYSTLMDLALLKKPALLIPTPGQTEQLYLAERLFLERIFNRQFQSEINIEKAWAQRNDYPGFLQNQYNNNRYEEVLEKWLAS